MAEEIVEVNADEKEVIGSPKTPNKDTNMYCSFRTSQLLLIQILMMTMTLLKGRSMETYL